MPLFRKKKTPSKPAPGQPDQSDNLMDQITTSMNQFMSGSQQTQTRIDNERKNAQTAMRAGNKAKAASHLKRCKHLERQQQLQLKAYDQIDAMLSKAREATMLGETAKTYEMAAKLLEQKSKEIDQIPDLLDRAADAMDEITGVTDEFLLTSIGGEMDDEIADELAELEAEMDAEKLDEFGAVPTGAAMGSSLPAAEEKAPPTSHVSSEPDSIDMMDLVC
ncbi:Snf7 family like protein [Aduncisulcus paluster]|uniref:Snf7 family like protein n=1 Tax=Aduncisulcus paluster TaxID=2918883 RepID=A0ABQ5JV80_9EUKA|nr:Snf7 family like protein [Aduncisulcus paluster]